MRFELKKTLRGVSDDELLNDMRRVAAKLGRDTVTISEYSEHGLGHASTIQRRFGSWFTALEKASLAPSRSRIGLTDDQLFENLEKLWLALGRQPSYAEVKPPLSAYSVGTYAKRYGNWTKSLEAFVEWVNTDDASGDFTGSTQAKGVAKAAQRKRRTKREISDRMRFRILLRDGFKCKSCGATPLDAPGTLLHVDHIVPWSKGGETVPENLNTKCSKCNLGKGNAFEA